MKKIVALSLLIAVAAIVVAARLWPSRHEAVFYPMGGIPFRVIAYDRSDFAFKDDVRAAENLVEELEGIFNSHRDSSELSRINREAHDRQFKMSADMARVILSAKDWWGKTGGAFDVTVGPLIRLWKEAAEKGILPGESEIENTKKYIGMDKLRVIANIVTQSPKSLGIATAPPATKASAGRSGPRPEEGLRPLYGASNDFSVQIDLGGIAKGDIVDQVAMLMQERGVKRGIIQAGGDTHAFGPGTFRIGIQDPTARGGEALIGEVEVSEGAIVTSGNYERFAQIGGKKYSHIIDPETGMPIDNGLEAATVIAGKTIDADALATALMVLGREKAIKLLRNNPEFKAILVEKNNDEYIVWAPSGLGDRMHFEKPWSDWIKIY